VALSGQVPVGSTAASADAAVSGWRDARRTPAQRAEALVALMTLEEKVAQLVGVWVGADASGRGVAPYQAEMLNGTPWGTLIRHGLGRRTQVSSVDPTPAFPFGHGLSYTTFEWTGAAVPGSDEWPVDGEASVQISVRNTGSRAGTDVITVAALPLRLSGAEREVGHDRRLRSAVRVARTPLQEALR
jgi:hypothetical protein